MSSGFFVSSFVTGGAELAIAERGSTLSCIPMACAALAPATRPVWMQ
eukprot:CAMPEP_0197620082 /NCGR_PEP_ID=MMETSP1338-20131121/966_1 /TAXON_ID=43686 ORGANISM="Pelagodinium beii, Strain RCC1491" /NCGR_SAMPLE_ID=MMETSP1338 /ASSEMBLY_ACC=CAM_ASM_000754 /LENGTH=46 /DNA_ID= /DNA_START= /DNA_END= /DNA_ORIENTATION=